MSRPAAVGVVLLVALGAAVFALTRWPSPAPALDCPPTLVSLDDAGVARCGPGAPLTVPQKLTVGQRFDLNAVGAEELAKVPGLGGEVAKALVEARARLGGFTTWEEVDEVPGVGPARLATLRQVAEIRVLDAGS